MNERENVLNTIHIKNEVTEVRNSVEKLVTLITDRTINELKTNRLSREFSILDKDSYSWSNFMVFSQDAGIYLFEADFSKYYKNWLETKIDGSTKTSIRDKWFNELKKLWGGIDKSPAFYKNRAIFHHSINNSENKFMNGWVPLYVGKSKNVKSRIYEHIEGNSPNTYGMKLSYRRKELCDIKFRISYSGLEEIDDDLMYVLVSVIENNVRDAFNPIIGKQ